MQLYFDSNLYRPILEDLDAKIKTGEIEMVRLRAALESLTPKVAEWKRIRSAIAMQIDVEAAEGVVADPQVDMPSSQELAVRSTLIAAAKILKGRKEANDKSHREVATLIMKQKGCPLSIQDLLEEMSRIGHQLPVHPKVAYSSVYSALDRHRSQFQQLSDKRWQLVGQVATSDPEDEYDSETNQFDPPG